jgi:GNAT superfamily N-acetyltransferase
MSTPEVRCATAADAPAILTLVDALADYEKLDRPTPAARERLVQDLFGPKPRLECWLAFLEGSAIGYAFTVETYSSFLALPTLYLEDLFIREEYRGRKAGFALFQRILDEARLRGCGRIEWTVLDWNQIAMQFYDKLGGKWLKDWRLYRITL